jgi:2-polyprenyl-3-methyl-5-hydroxy-6-metoxy-1,4-benzoquinol methylase
MIHSHSIINSISHPKSLDLEYVVCDYCGEDTSEILAALPPITQISSDMHRYGASKLDYEDGEINFVRCQNCGLVYMNPRLKEDAIGRFYDNVYGDGVYSGFLHNTLHRENYILDKIENFLDVKSPHILDIGCGAGQLLYAAQQRDWLIHGSELSETAAQAASQRLHESIYHGDFREMGLKQNSLDIISMKSVVEHLLAPIDFLRDSVSLLKSGGILYFNVPNIKSWEYRYAELTRQVWRGFIIEHLYYFDATLIERILFDLGVEIIWMNSWLPNSQFPNPLADIGGLLRKKATSEAQSSGSNDIIIPPLESLSLPKRILRQLNNYTADAIGVLSNGQKDKQKTEGNLLMIWARKR